MSTDGSPKQAGVAIAWLAALVLLLLVAMIVVHRWDHASLLSVSRVPLLLLGWWVGVTRVRVSWKLAGVCLGITVVFLLYSRSYMNDPTREIPWNKYDWITFPFLVANVIETPVAIILFVAGGRLLRWRRVSLTTPFAAGSTAGADRAWQYTLKDVLVVTFTLAATLGLLLWTAPYPAWLLALPAMWLGEFSGPLAGYYGSEAAGGVLATFAAAWVCLGRGRVSRRLIYVLLIAFWPPIAAGSTLMSASVSGALPDMDMAAAWREWLPEEYYRLLVLFAFLLGSFAMVRLAGCRLECEDRRAQQPQAAAEE